MKVAFCCPTMTKPFPQFIAAMEATVPLLDAAGIEHQMVFEVGCPYISHARATMTRKALDAGADVIVYLDHDLSWDPAEMVQFVQTEAEVLAGSYRFKKDEVEYMGTIQSDTFGRPMVTKDGHIVAEWVPAGFLKVSRGALRKMMKAFPELLYGAPEAPHFDLFNHGAHNWLWYGEDYAFSRRYNERCGPVWIMPDLNLTHWKRVESPADLRGGYLVDYVPYHGNLHEHLLRQPGGSKSSNPIAPTIKAVA
jgi:hypothetical protein